MRALLIIGAVALGACGPMYIRTNDPSAEIYLDGEHVGTGIAEVSRIGPPRTSTIRVIAGGAATERSVERSFTVGTLGLGLVSVYTGLYWAWFYPEEVVIEVPTGAQPNPWAPRANEENPWAPKPGGV